LPFASPSLVLDVIVVDNGSTDGSPEMVASEFPAVRLIRNTENVGFVLATNQGLLAGTGDFLFSLNSDTEVRPGCIERLVEVASSDPAIGAVGPRLLNPDGTPQVSVAPFPLVIHRLLPSRFEHAYNVRVEQRLLASTAGVSRVDWVSGAALLFRRDVLERVGPLDERYYMWYDDVDWAQKLRKAGYDRVFVADAAIVHHGRSSARKLDNLALAQQMFDSEYTYLRLHAGLAATWMVFSLRVAKAFLRWLVPLGASRADAAFRLSYHAQRFRRFCLSSLPPRVPAQSPPAG
jgi:GT2 family glycosyltransferase